MEAFWLTSQGLSHGEIAPLTSISVNTLPVLNKHQRKSKN